MIPERSAIQGPVDPRKASAFGAPSNVTGRPHKPTPKIKKRGVYGLVNTPSPQKRRNLRARRAALMMRPEQKTAMNGTKGRGATVGAGRRMSLATDCVDMAGLVVGTASPDSPLLWPRLMVGMKSANNTGARSTTRPTACPDLVRPLRQQHFMLERVQSTAFGGPQLM